jgi:hypothetical protein
VNSRLAIATLLVILFEVAILAFGEKKTRAQDCELGAFGCGPSRATPPIQAMAGEEPAVAATATIAGLWAPALRCDPSTDKAAAS